MDTSETSPTAPSRLPPIVSSEISAAADRTVQELAAVSLGEGLLITVGVSGETDFVRALAQSAESAGAHVRTVVFRSSDPLVAASELARAIDECLPDVIVELADPSLYRAPVLSRFLAGGGRVLSLTGMEDEAVERLIPNASLYALQATQSELLARVSRARFIVIQTEGGELSARLDTDSISRMIRRMRGSDLGFVFSGTPVPIAWGQLAFAIGQVSFVGRRRSMNGHFHSAAFCSHPALGRGAGVAATLAVREGVVQSLRGDLHPAALASLHARPMIEHISIGFLPKATFEGGLLEAERVAGCVTIGFGEHPMHIDVVASNATILLDGEIFVEAGALPRGGKSTELDRPEQKSLLAIRSVVAPIKALKTRCYQADGGRILFAGTCPQEPSWLARWGCRTSIGPETSTVRIGRLHGSLRGADLAVLRVGDVRVAAERLHPRPLRVPLLIEQRLALDGVRSNGLAALASGSSTKDDLRLLRKHELRRSALELTADRLIDFHRNYYLPLMRARHGSLAGYRTMEELSSLCGRADLLAVLHQERPIAMGIVSRCGVEPRLEVVGVLHGAQSLVKLGALSATYLFAAEHAAQSGASHVNFGGSLPFLNDGVLTFKGKWGSLPIVPETSDTYRVFVPELSSRAQSFIARNPVIACGNEGSLVGVGAVTSSEDLDRVRLTNLPGLTGVLFFATEDLIEPTRAAISKHIGDRLPWNVLPDSAWANAADEVDRIR